MTDKYFHQTWDLVIYEHDDHKRHQQVKRLNYEYPDEPQKIKRFLEKIFYGIEWFDYSFEVEEGPVLNTLAIKANRDAMMRSQLIDLPIEDIDYD